MVFINDKKNIEIKIKDCIDDTVFFNLEMILNLNLVIKVIEILIIKDIRIVF